MDYYICLSTDGVSLMMLEHAASIPNHLPFWFKPISTFGLSHVTMFIDSSHMLTILSTLAPYRFNASRVEKSSRSSLPKLAGYIVLRASHPQITPYACLSRVLMMRHQVESL